MEYIYKDNLILDVGLYTGADTKFYLGKGFDVVAIEANPKYVKLCQKEFKKEIEARRLKIINKAVGDRNDKIKFYINKRKNDWGSIIQDWNRNESQKNDEFDIIEVELVPMNEILQETGVPYYMKIDIEGADELALKSMLEIPIKPKYISVELLSPDNYDDESEVNYMEILCLLYALGYKKFTVSDQSRHDKIILPNPPLEGSYFSVNFNAEYSGLFGKELQGKWVSIDKMTKYYMDYCYRQKKSKDRVVNIIKKRLSKLSGNPFNRFGWFDIHATY